MANHIVYVVFEAKPKMPVVFKENVCLKSEWRGTRKQKIKKTRRRKIIFLGLFFVVSL